MGIIFNFDEQVVHGTDKKYGKLQSNEKFFTDYNYAPMIAMLKDKLKLAYNLRKTRYETPFKFTKNLFWGLKNNDILELQKRLVKEGLATYEPTGYFGILTLASVKAYQTKHGITPVWGYVGPKTRASLNSTSTPVPVHLEEL